MYPLQLSAQFAAYAWYTEVRGRTTHAEALRFAERNWGSFLPSAHEGWGTLLMRLANPRRRRTKTQAMVRVNQVPAVEAQQEEAPCTTPSSSRPSS